MAVFCSQCGHPRKAESQFCGGCGAALSSSGQATIYMQTSATPPAPIKQLKVGFKFHSRPYTILEHLGKGGMGIVYKAANQNLYNRPVVIKALINADDPVLQQQFEHEIKTLSQLHYPSIAPIIESFKEDHVLYLVMEYIDGIDLERQLGKQNNKPFAVYQVVEWGIQLGRMLEYLHSHVPPIVHHDIKPSNIIIHEGSKQLYLIDFGIAKLRLQQASGGYKQTSLHGTEGYAPPEQYQGLSEPRSDVYALAATLYHLLTGDDPRDHPQSFPNLGTLPALLKAIFNKALQPEARDRYTAQEFVEQLEQIKAGAQRATDHFASASLRAPLIAPDGTSLANKQKLGEWCQAHPQQALAWINDELPSQIANLWGDTKRSLTIKRYRHTYAHYPHILCDMVVEQLLKTYPQVELEYPQELDLGTLGAQRTLQTEIKFTNPSSRPVLLSIQGDSWLSHIQTSCDIPSHSTYRLPLMINLPEPTASQGRWRATLSCTPHTGQAFTIPIHAKTSRRQLMLDRYVWTLLNFKTRRSMFFYAILLFFSLSWRSIPEIFFVTEEGRWPFFMNNGVFIGLALFSLGMLSPWIARIFKQPIGKHSTLSAIKHIVSVVILASMLVGIIEIVYTFSTYIGIATTGLVFNPPTTGVWGILQLGLQLMPCLLIIFLLRKQRTFGFSVALLLALPLLITPLFSYLISLVTLPEIITANLFNLHFFTSNIDHALATIVLLGVPTWLKYRRATTA